MVLINWSVKKDVDQKLKKLYINNNKTIFKDIQPEFIKKYIIKIIYYTLINLIFYIYKKLNYPYKGKMLFFLNQEKYHDLMRKSKYIISWRFHWICLWIKFRKNIIWIESNNYKISWLLEMYDLKNLINISNLNNHLKLSNYNINKEKLEDINNKNNIAIEKLFKTIKILIQND